MKERMEITLSDATGDIFVPFEGGFFSSFLRDRLKKKQTLTKPLLWGLVWVFFFFYSICSTDVSWSRGGLGSVVSLLDFGGERVKAGG